MNLSGTPTEVGDWMKKLPDDTSFVLIVQRGDYRMVLRSEGFSKGDNWPRAVWNGVADALNVPPIEPKLDA